MMARLGVELGARTIRAVRIDAWRSAGTRVAEVDWDLDAPDEAVLALRDLGAVRRIAVAVDSGYVQPLDFFGDGTRIPLIVVSPYSKGVGMVHTYGDHVSFDKFVEANWGLETIAPSGRDNLPNPIATRENPYVPRNAPAIGDLMDMFDFGHHRSD